MASKLYLVGDTHGFFGPLKKISEEAAPEDVIVQVGDLGFWPNFRKDWTETGIKRPIHFIEGNHEFFPNLKGITEIKEVWLNLFYIPRGTILKLGSKRIAFCGGASSVDFQWRSLGVDWFLEEVVSQKDIERFVGVKDIDLLVTHSPPISLNKSILDNSHIAQFHLPDDWMDNSAASIDVIWSLLGSPPLVCGHLHQHIAWKNVTVLNCAEAWPIDLGEN